MVRAEPEYLIENKGPTAVREVDTGVETLDGRQSHAFPGFHIPALGAGQDRKVVNVGSIPREMLEGAHERAAFSSHYYWATFEDVDGNQWKARYDPRDTSHAYEVLACAGEDGDA